MMSEAQVVPACVPNLGLALRVDDLKGEVEV
jgi:hypothetical protein